MPKWTFTDGANKGRSYTGSAAASEDDKEKAKRAKEVERDMDAMLKNTRHRGVVLRVERVQGAGAELFTREFAKEAAPLRGAVAQGEARMGKIDLRGLVEEPADDVSLTDPALAARIDTAFDKLDNPYARGNGYYMPKSVGKPRTDLLRVHLAILTDDALCEADDAASVLASAGRAPKDDLLVLEDDSFDALVEIPRDVKQGDVLRLERMTHCTGIWRKVSPEGVELWRKETRARRARAALPEAERCKRRGNAAYGRREWELAESHYSAGLAAPPAPHPTTAALRCNRAAARLALGDAQGALDDCDAALALGIAAFRADGDAGDAGSPPPLLLKAQHRRESALCKLGS